MAGEEKSRGLDWVKEWLWDWLANRIGDFWAGIIWLTIFLLAIAVWQWKNIKDNPVVRSCLNWFKSIPRAKGDRPAVLLFALGEDNVGNQRAIVKAAVDSLGGVEVLQTGKTIITTSDEKGHAAVRKYLVKSRASLAIWGRTVVSGGTEGVVLWITMADCYGVLRTERCYAPQVTSQDLRMPPAFGVEIGVLVRASVALAVYGEVTESMLFRYSADKVLPVARDLENLILSNWGTWSPEEVARLNFLLGNAFALSGEQIGDESYLYKAIAAYNETLNKPILEIAPTLWAATKINLGLSLRVLGEREGSIERLVETVSIYNEVLKACPREKNPIQWALTQHYLGISLSSLGTRTGSTEKIEEAVSAFHEALKEYSRKQWPIWWAMVQNNLGIALSVLGEKEGNSQKLGEAASAFREVISETTREQFPLFWAGAQVNLGNALETQGKIVNNLEMLALAIIAFREGLKEYKREHVPLDWAMTQNNLGNALSALGAREGGKEKLEEAIVAYREALKERTRKKSPLQWAATQNNLGNALRILGDMEGNAKRLGEAVDIFREVLKEQSRENVPIQWAATKNNLGLSLLALWKIEEKAEKLVEAFDVWFDCWEESLARSHRGYSLTVAGTIIQTCNMVTSGFPEVKILIEERFKAKLVILSKWLKENPDVALSLGLIPNEKSPKPQQRACM